MTTTLHEYLVGLDSADRGWGVWVNPEDPLYDWRVGQDGFESGEYCDNWHYIGTLEQLSFGDQSRYDAFDEIIDYVMNGKAKGFERSSLKELYFDDELHQGLAAEIDEAIDEQCEKWSDELASQFIEQMYGEIRIYKAEREAAMA